VISGNFANAGVIGSEMKELKVSYNCLKSEKDVDTIVELSIEMLLYESI
jgi:hypothetical protein